MSLLNRSQARRLNVALSGVLCLGFQYRVHSLEDSSCLIVIFDHSRHCSCFLTQAAFNLNLK